MTDEQRPSQRWLQIVERWRESDLGDDPPEWLSEYPTGTELAMGDIHSTKPLPLDHERAWRMLVDRYARAGMGAPPSELRQHASSIIAAILADEADEADDQNRP